MCLAHQPCPSISVRHLVTPPRVGNSHLSLLFHGPRRQPTRLFSHFYSLSPGQPRQDLFSQRSGCPIEPRKIFIGCECLNSGTVRTNNSISVAFSNVPLWTLPFSNNRPRSCTLYPPLISPSCPSIGQSSSSLPLHCLVACRPCALHHRCAHLNRSLIPRSHISIEICSSPYRRRTPSGFLIITNVRRPLSAPASASFRASD